MLFARSRLCHRAADGPGNFFACDEAVGIATAWIYEKVTGVDGMGGGDIKLLAMIGAFLGWPSIPVTLFIASVLGSVIGVGLMVVTGAGRRLALPFAPFLCSGAIAYLFYGDALIRFYLPVS